MNKKATSLVEVIMTLFILVMATSSITVLIVTAMRAGGSSKDKFVATNFAREGVESVVNIVATNWIRFPSEKAKCWNILDENVFNSDDCDGNKIDGNTSYILNWADPGTSRMNPNRPYMKWKLQGVGDPLDLEDPSFLEQMKRDYCMENVNISGREGLSYQDPGTITDCKFFRETRIEYPESGDNSEKEMEVISKVQWFDKSEVKTVEISTKIYNGVY